MKPNFIIALLMLCCGTVLSAQAPAYWQQRTDYTISVSLNDTTHSLTGFLQLQYYNQSPDTLTFIWMHLWPNAYKNDKTAYSEQSLLAGDTRFYFAKPADKGYINRLNFEVDGTPAKTEDHPAYIDIVKLQLPRPLLPGQMAKIETHFHVQLPALFDRGGHLGQFYSVTQWFPKAAVYDKKGWHPMPYQYSGEYYSNFGNYTVSITLPSNYVVAATGQLQSEEETAWLKTKTSKPQKPVEKTAPKQLFKTNTTKKKDFISSSANSKTLLYQANNVVDFAWFADKHLLVKYDTLQLDKRTISIWNFFHPEDEKNWSQSINFTKRAVRFYSEQLGNYPYPQISIVSNPVAKPDGMEYPMISLLNVKPPDHESLDILIAHEAGHNWLQAVLASNERDHAWMDEGLNSWLERKYHTTFYSETEKAGEKKKTGKLPDDGMELSLQKRLSQHEDQPINTIADAMKPAVYYDVVYTKTALWMEGLEKQLGADVLSTAMRQYFSQWQFRHPQPEDLRLQLEQTAGTSLSSHFQLLDTTGLLPWETQVKRKTKATFLYNFNHTATTKYIGIAPAFGYNNYDKFEIGLLVHNYNIPNHRFQFALAPMLATGTGQLVGYAHGSNTWYPKKRWHSLTAYAGVARFNTNENEDINGEGLPTAFLKITPGITLNLKPRNALSTLKRSIDFRTFIISEQQVLIESPEPPGDTVFYAVRNGASTTIIPQLTLSWRNERVLYPWEMQVGIQQVKQLVRTTFTGRYFLNYSRDNKGISARLFAGKIFYTTEKTSAVRNDNSRYHFTMYAPNGEQDYTYSTPFADRNQATTLAGRQIATRDGGFKYRSDYSGVVPGLKPTGVDYFDNWMITLNTQFDIPEKLNPLAFLPFDVNWKIFADVGTSASPWQQGSEQSKFLYSIGLHLPILKVLHFYYPIVHSDAFNEPNSVNDPFREGGPLWWQKRLTFSIDTQQLKNYLQQFPF